MESTLPGDAGRVGTSVAAAMAIAAAPTATAISPRAVRVPMAHATLLPWSLSQHRTAPTAGAVVQPARFSGQDAGSVATSAVALRGGVATQTLTVEEAARNPSGGALRRRQSLPIL